MNRKDLETACFDDYRDRFYRKVKKIDGGCWLWKGATQDNNTGLFMLPGYSHRRRAVVRRLTWIFEFGDLDEHQHLFQTCSTPGCINPYHLSMKRPLVAMHDRNTAPLPMALAQRLAIINSRR